VDLAVAGGRFDWRSAVIGGEVITAGKPRDVADVAQDGGGDDGTDPVDLGHGGRGRGDLSSKAPFHLAALRVDAAQIDDQVMGELEPGVGDRAVHCETVQDVNRLSCRDFSAESAGHKIAQHCVQSAHHLSA
jgi:hypothetical protein